jgi:hypothetical protein
MKGEHRLARDVAGGKDIPCAAQRRLLKFGLLYVFLLSFTAPLATSATAATGCFPILFSAMADWCRWVAASSTTLHRRIIHLTDRTSIQSFRAINPHIPYIHQ